MQHPTPSPATPARHGPTAWPGRHDVADALERVIDPEIGVDDGFVLVDLGVTTPSCPYSRHLAAAARAAVLDAPCVTGAHVLLAFDLPWNPAMMSDRARAALGWR